MKKHDRNDESHAWIPRDMFGAAFLDLKPTAIKLLGLICIIRFWLKGKDGNYTGKSRSFVLTYPFAKEWFKKNGKSLSKKSFYRAMDELHDHGFITKWKKDWSIEQSGYAWICLHSSRYKNFGKKSFKVVKKDRGEIYGAAKQSHRNKIQQQEIIQGYREDLKQIRKGVENG